MKNWNIAMTALSALCLSLAVSLGAHHAGPSDQASAAVQHATAGNSGAVGISLCISVTPDDPGWDCTT